MDNYLETDSLDPRYWGNCGWIFINSIALTYKPIHREKYKLFFSQLPYILPCITCGKNMELDINNLDFALESKEKLLTWLLNIRNKIYIDQKHLFKIKNLAESINEIFHPNQSNKYLLISLQLIILICLIVLLYFIFKNNTFNE